jgi:serine/threonine protein kinase
MIGSKVAHFEITALLGSGGMGEVYQATDTKLGRSVAIKLLPEAVTHDTLRTYVVRRASRIDPMICAVCVKKQHLGKAKPVVGFSLRVGYSQFVAPRNARQLWQRTA